MVRLHRAERGRLHRISGHIRGNSLEPESAQIKTTVRHLKDIDEQLAYLVLLTCEGIKPLSRWEKPLEENGLNLLEGMGLVTKQIRRTVKTQKEIIETIFSRSPGYIRAYEARFADTPIDKSPQARRFEGFLFGYPPCCVEQFIRHPYAKNELKPKDQKILFHWACSKCKITPILLPAYKRLHSILMNS